MIPRPYYTNTRICFEEFFRDLDARTRYNFPKARLENRVDNFWSVQRFRKMAALMETILRLLEVPDEN